MQLHDPCRRATGEAIVVDGGDGVDEVVCALRPQRLAREATRAYPRSHRSHRRFGRPARTYRGSALLHPGDLPLYDMLALQARWIGLADVPPSLPRRRTARRRRAQSWSRALRSAAHAGAYPGSVCFELRATANGAADRRYSLRRLHRPLGYRRNIDGGYRSLDSSTKLMDFGDATPVVPGHGPFTTIGIERRSNPYLRG